MSNEIHGPGVNKVGHNKTKQLGTGELDYVESAVDGWANNHLWEIDFVHVATGKCVVFKAFLNNFADSYQSNWNAETVFGRMDPIPIYQNTQRSISLSFSVPSSSQKNAEKNLHKFEHLAALLYPVYDDAGGVSTMAASPLLRVKFTNLIADASAVGQGASSQHARTAGLVCWTDGFGMEPNTDLGFYAPKPGILYPKAFDISMTLNVIHTHKLGWSRASKWLGDQEGAKRWPYGVHRQTGDHSICTQGKLVNKGKADSKSINDAKANKILGGPAGAPAGEGNGKLIPGSGPPKSNDDQDVPETPTKGPAKPSGGRNKGRKRGVIAGVLFGG